MNTIECNQKCTKCSHWKYKDKAGRLSTDRFISEIRMISTVKELCIVGGEPLLFKSEISRILKGVADTDIRTVVITNGVLLDEEFVNSISNYNIHIVVSIDTMNKEFWKYVRGKDSYEKVISNFEYATTILTPKQISIQSVLSIETKPFLDDVSLYAKSKNVYHSIQDYISVGFEGSWTEIKKNNDNSLYIEQQCYASDRNLSIVQNGDVYTCFQQTWIEGCQEPLGNLNTKTMTEILNSEYAISVSKKMRECNLPCKVLKCNLKN